MTRVKNLWIKRPRVAERASERSADTLNMSVVNFSIKNLLQHDRQPRERERERASLLCACIQHMIHWAFLMRRAEGTFYDVIWEANKKRAPLQFHRGTEFISLSWHHTGERSCATLGLSRGCARAVTFACRRPHQRNAHDKVRAADPLAHTHGPTPGALHSCAANSSGTIYAKRSTVSRMTKRFFVRRRRMRI